MHGVLLFTGFPGFIGARLIPRLLELAPDVPWGGGESVDLVSGWCRQPGAGAGTEKLCQPQPAQAARQSEESAHGGVGAGEVR